MAAPVLEALALQVILGLPSGTELSIPDLMAELNLHLPVDSAITDPAAVGAAARYLASLGYLQVGRDEPTLYRVP